MTAQAPISLSATNQTSNSSIIDTLSLGHQGPEHSSCYQRHSLCYLNIDSQALKETLLPLSLQAARLLQYWLKRKFPLIYTKQPPELKDSQVQLALPYFKIKPKEKLRLSYRLPKTAIIKHSALPSLSEIFPTLKLEAKPILRVYGSYCWQYLTSKPYVQPSSDLDLQILYTNESLQELRALNALLKIKLQQSKQAVSKIDGEVRFPYFGDCAWMELVQNTSADSILFKSAQKIYLLARKELYAAFPSLLD